MLGKRPNDVKQSLDRGAVKMLIEGHGQILAVAVVEFLERLAHSQSRTGDHMIETNFAVLELVADPARGLAPPIVERTVEIVDSGFVPARFRVSKDGEDGHST